MRCLILLSIAFWMAGCKINVSGDVIIGDLMNVAFGHKETILTPGTLRLEMSSLDTCQNERANLGASLERFFINFTPKTCEQSGMETYLLATIDIPVTASRDAWKMKTRSTFGILSKISDQIGGIEVEMLLHQGLFKELSKTIESKYFQKLDFSGSRLNLTLKNDQRALQVVLIADAFVNGDPVTVQKSIPIDPMNRLDIEISDVRREHLSRMGWVPMFSLVMGI
ncbi:MAG: hypothetical protein COV67_14830 [Nitrospinae bacterium CG11_big_fil_rev_8_21_14_0_20_56_8]|nr:MAG: hypothetical protein COV67_14830 [Nitrospinae bacterium CG11_big_fil_rev_8_21_14_0_20_56_8]